MRLAHHVHVVCRVPARADEYGRPLNGHVVDCEPCNGTGFLHEAPHGGWCAECQGLGWLAVVTLADLVKMLGVGLGAVALTMLALAVAP